MENASGVALRNHLKACMELPRRGIPFAEAIFALTGCRVIPFDGTAAQDQDLLARLVEAAETARREAAQNGIAAARPNEAGNKIEPFVLSALERSGLRAGRPVSRSGSGKTAGYPDLEVADAQGRAVYVDCKTYSQETHDQTFRSFYLSLTDDPKITKDALHIIFGFELEKTQRASQNAFVPQAWTIWSLDALSLQLKYEFNASNRDLYAKQSLLADRSGVTRKS